MIKTLLDISWINLKRDRVELLLTFALPIGFFSFFVAVFGGGNSSGTPRPPALDVALVDLDATAASRAFVDALAAESALRSRAESEAEAITDPDAAREAVRSGDLDAAIVIDAGFDARLGTFVGETPRIEVIFDAANPMAEHIVTGLVQATAFQVAPSRMMVRGLAALEIYAGPLTAAQRRAIDAVQAAPDGGVSGDDANADVDTNGGDGFAGLVTVDSSPARKPASADKRPSLVSYYAAGVGVMFLLFSMVGAAGGLLEAEEYGILDRMLASRVGMSRLLGGYWLFFTLLGTLQVTTMFVWGAAVFDLELLMPHRIAGTLVMAAVTAMAAAGFGLVMAALCKTRGQLNGISTVVVLLLSAIGGSMVPRFVLPESIARLSKLTFNGWALDGFLKVFWYDDPADGVVATLRSIVPEIAVLLAATLVFMVTARMLARRWEAV